MIIKAVTFEVVPEEKDRFKIKIAKDLAALQNANGCLDFDCWVEETKQVVRFQLISKWQDKKDFQAWLKRPEHLEEHRVAHQQRENSPKVVLKKTMAEFTPFDELTW